MIKRDDEVGEELVDKFKVVEEGESNEKYECGMYEKIDNGD